MAASYASLYARVLWPAPLGRPNERFTLPIKNARRCLVGLPARGADVAPTSCR